MKPYAASLKTFAALLMLLALVAILLPCVNISSNGHEAQISGIDIVSSGVNLIREHNAKGSIEADYKVIDELTWGDLNGGTDALQSHNQLKKAVAGIIVLFLPVIFCFLSMIFTFVAIGKKSMILPTLFLILSVTESLIIGMGVNDIASAVIKYGSEQGMAAEASFSISWLIGCKLFLILTVVALAIILLLWIFKRFDRPDEKENRIEDRDGDNRERAAKEKRGSRRKSKRKKKSRGKDKRKKKEKKDKKDNKDDKKNKREEENDSRDEQNIDISGVKNIIFDVGNVLLEYRWKDMLTDHGIPEKEATQIGRMLFDDPMWSKMDLADSKGEENIIRAFEEKYPEYAETIRWFISHAELMHVNREDVWRKVAMLKRMGFKLYILSNYSENLFEKHARHADFMKYFDGEVISYQVGKIKPDPAIYMTLLLKYDLNPAECLFFDDRQENVDAAKKLGIRSFTVTSRSFLLGKLDTILRMVTSV